MIVESLMAELTHLKNIPVQKDHYNTRYVKAA